MATMLLIIIQSTVRVYGDVCEIGRMSKQNARQLLSTQPMERNTALNGLVAVYGEVSASLLQTLEEAISHHRSDRNYLSPLHTSILAAESWGITSADEALLSIVDYDLDTSTMPLGMDVPGNYFFPAAKALVHLRVDVAKIEKAIAAAGNHNSLRILTWILLEREGDIEKAKMALSDASSKRHGTTEIQNINKALELLENTGDLLPEPSRGSLSSPN